MPLPSILTKFGGERNAAKRKFDRRKIGKRTAIVIYYSHDEIRVKIPNDMKLDVLIIRIGFVLLLVSFGYLLNPLGQTTHLSESLSRGSRQFISALLGAAIAAAVIGFEMRARRASLKTLIGAAFGSILGIIGAYLIGMLISSQETAAVNPEIKTFATVALAFFMAYIG
ncbi:MAG: hypothetical protein LH614_07725, partial [Pyrinomonadaceae bacterium]|nr:hypothetical protein [Pyrinomonadaceae bacterium]